jgi:hypothetical protein
MTRRWFALTCISVLAGVSPAAQSRGAAADPISGTWTGELSPPDAPRNIPVTMELKFDGRSMVTGTVAGLPNPADVKAGTFAPKTGNLTLRLGKTGDPAVLLILEGAVVKGTATGSVTGPTGTGTFKIAKKT